MGTVNLLRLCEQRLRNAVRRYMEAQKGDTVAATAHMASVRFSGRMCIKAGMDQQQVDAIILEEVNRGHGGHA